MTKLEICNRALGVIGHDRIITSFDDGSVEAVRAEQFFAAALRNILSAYNWDFATKEEEVEVEGNKTTWSIPSDFVKIVAVTDQDGHAMTAKRQGSNLVITGHGTAKIEYVAEDEGIIEAMPHLVTEAVIYELAALLFGPMIGNVQDSQGNALYQSYMSLAGAKLQAAIQAEDSEHAFLGGERGGDTASKTDIVNLALARLGSTATVSDFESDSSPIAARSRLVWKSTYRDLLQKRNWDFASVERVMSVCGVPSDDGYSRVPIPGDFLKLVSIHDTRGCPLEVRRNARDLMVNAADGEIVLRYIADVELEYASGEFVDLFTLALAARLAPSVMDDKNAVELVERKFNLALGELAYREANETAAPGEWKNDYITSRR